MTKEGTISSYSAEQLRRLRQREGSKTDWNRVDALADAGVERLVAEDEDERGLVPDWTRAELVMPTAKRSVNLRLDADVIDFFKAQGKGHIRRMQAVLRAYVDAHRHEQR
ncbi:MAG: BrnA antitoxin family protein [Defluviicoccus sp.]|nr:MAG: BrnA antitoxin family protein [Defluviicoccus sp.]